MDRDQVRQRLRSYVLATFLVGEDPATLQDSTPLISSGIVSSLALLELVSFMEGEFSVKLEQQDLSRDRLDTIDLLVDLVQQRKTT